MLDRGRVQWASVMALGVVVLGGVGWGSSFASAQPTDSVLRSALRVHGPQGLELATPDEVRGVLEQRRSVTIGLSSDPGVVAVAGTISGSPDVPVGRQGLN